jgi:16S rRNA (cytidine1402-2'-O)-methyltransferase
LEREKQEQTKKGTLFVVSTPIGNKKDITYRAAEVLQNADIVVGEEIKETARLLMNLSLTKPIELLNEHNENEKAIELVEFLKQGKTIALVSDCGTPVFADPGFQLVKLCLSEKLNVTVVPGVTSIMTALVRSGFTTKQFLYAGFLNRIGEDRTDEILQLAKVRKTVILMDTPYRLKILLEAFANIIPNREVYIGMNLTMPSETHHYGTFKELYEKFKSEKFKSEYVIVFSGLDNSDKVEKARLSKMISLRLINRGGVSSGAIESDNESLEFEDTARDERRGRFKAEEDFERRKLRSRSDNRKPREFKERGEGFKPRGTYSRDDKRGGEFREKREGFKPRGTYSRDDKRGGEFREKREGFKPRGTYSRDDKRGGEFKERGEGFKPRGTYSRDDKRGGEFREKREGFKPRETYSRDDKRGGEFKEKREGFKPRGTYSRDDKRGGEFREKREGFKPRKPFSKDAGKSNNKPTSRRKK